MRPFARIFLLSSFLAPSLGVVFTDPSQLPTTTYDYIVVGGGTAGNVIANRLTENSQIRVLILEAGVSDNGVTAAQIPFLAQSLVPGYDWGYSVAAQTGLNNRVFPYPRGKILGGSSTTNYMVHQYGASDDWDRIATDTGDTTWSWNTIKTYINKHEHIVAPTDGHNTAGQYIPANHATTGMLPVSLPGNSQPIDANTILTTSQLSEFPFNSDMGGGSVLGIGWVQGSISAGARTSSSTSYLANASSRPNLFVLLNATVMKLIQTSTMAGLPVFTGVQFASSSTATPSSVFAIREIVLSAGAIGTPQILLLSGVGPTADLTALGITTIINNPSVGQNLSDHALLPNNFAVQGTSSYDDILRGGAAFTSAMNTWTSSQTGVFANTVTNNIGFFRLPSTSSIFSTASDPSTGPNAPHWELVVTNFWLNPTVAQPSTGSYMTVSSIVISPSSRGSLKLASTNPFTQPIIDPKFLTTSFDMFCMREAVRAVKRFVAAPAWSGYVTGPVGALSATTDADLDTYARAQTTSIYHPIGTAALSSVGASWGVVDPNLKLKGAFGVRIVDASVFPRLPSAHTQGPVYLLAEKGADLIKSDQHAPLMMHEHAPFKTVLSKNGKNEIDFQGSYIIAQRPLNRIIMSTATPEISESSKSRPTCLPPPVITAPESLIPEGSGGAVLTSADRLWENGKVLTYGFQGPFSGSPIEQKKVAEVIKVWELYTNIQFRYVEDVKKALIRISFNPKNGSWSFVGKDVELIDVDKPTMNIGWLENRKEIVATDRGVILHEFGHTLGLEHEHQSPSRDRVLTLREKEIIEAYSKGPNKWTEKEVRQQILGVLDAKKVTNYTDLDLKSIMMYFMPEEQNEQGVEIGVNNKLTDTDKAFMLIHYPYFGPEPRDKDWSFERALDVLGIQEKGKKAIMQKFTNGDVDEIRYEFAKNYAAVREARNKELAEELKKQGIQN